MRSALRRNCASQQRTIVAYSTQDQSWCRSAGTGISFHCSITPHRASPLMHECTHARTHDHTHTQTCTHTCTRIHTHTHEQAAPTQTCTHTHTRTHTHTQTHTHTHTHTLKRTRTHIHKRKRALAQTLTPPDGAVKHFIIFCASIMYHVLRFRLYSPAKAC